MLNVLDFRNHGKRCMDGPENTHYRIAFLLTIYEYDKTTTI